MSFRVYAEANDTKSATTKRECRWTYMTEWMEEAGAARIEKDKSGGSGVKWMR